MSDVAGIARGLSEAQRKAVQSAVWRDGDGGWHFSGWFIQADRRVRYRLCAAGLLPDYLSPLQPLTHLGLAVRVHLQEQSR